MEDSLDRLDAAHRWYLEAVDALSEDQWQKPSLCAGWTAANVVAHIIGGDLYIRALIYDATGRNRAMLATLASDPGERMKRAQERAAWEPARLRDAAHVESGQTVAALHDVVREAPEAELHMPFATVPAPTAVNMRTSEYVVHGHDLEPATGRSHPVPAWFIERTMPLTMQMMTRMHQRSPHKGKSASFHLHRTDGEGEWMLRAEGGQAHADAVHAKGDVALRGPVAGLYWVLMGRGRPEDLGVEVHGDPALAGAFKEWFPGP
jgi:uncharacterized protein (TIGR03083 family)